MEHLLDTLKWSAVVGAAAALLACLKPALDKRYRPRWRYWVWPVLAVLLLLAPVQWEQLIPAVENAAPPVVVEVPYRQVTVGELTGVRTQTYRSGEDPDRVLPPNRGEIGLFDASSPEELAQAYRTAGITIKAETILTALWLAGIVCFLLYHLVGTLWFSRSALRWSRAAGAETEAAYDAVCREMGLTRRRPQLRVSPAAGSPMVIGLLRPRLLLPGEDYGERELGFILRHELTHYRRQDLWYQLLLLLANALHWFNPLVYLLRREAGADMELTCNDAVVEGADTEARRAYSETLLADLHRQRGLSRAALSTHFYGGAGVMKARFRNILGAPGRKKGAAALILALVLTLTAACSVGLKQAEEPAGEPLTEEELADWQEKLSSIELNGFVSRLYTDVRYLPLGELFYNYQDVQADGSILTHVPGNADEIYEETFGYRPDSDYTGITRALADAFLQEYTGYTVEDFRGGFGSLWIYHEDTDSWFFAHGDTNYCAVDVLSGTKSGDTVTLELSLPGGNMSGGVTGGTMTIVDGKIRSFTNILYAAVESAAWTYVNSAAQSLASSDYIVPAEGEALPEGPEIVDSYISGLWSYTSYEIDGKSYSVWNLEYRLKPDDISKVTFAGGRSEENGWVTETSSMGSPVLIFCVDGDGGVTFEESAWTSTVMEDGWTWEEYIVCRLYMGMDISYRLGGWPEIATPFIVELLEGGSAWATDWQDVALRYLEQQGRSCAADGLTVVYTFEPNNGQEQSLLVEADCGDETVTLFLCQIVYPVESWNATVTFWQVGGVLWGDGSSSAPGESDDLLQKTDFTVNEGRTGTLYLYGRQLGSGRYGVSQVELIWDDGGYQSFYTREAIVDQWGENSTDYHTLAQDEDGGLRLEDVNFDGYTDICLQLDCSAAYNWTGAWWLYDPETGTFRYAFTLGWDLTIDREARQLTYEFNGGSSDAHSRNTYAYRPDGSLFLAHRERFDITTGEILEVWDDPDGSNA